MTLKEEQEIRAVYVSASDEQLEAILANSKDYRPEVLDIVGEMLKSRKELSAASDEQLEGILANSKDYRPEVLGIVVKILQSRGKELPAEFAPTIPQAKKLSLSREEFTTTSGTVNLIRGCFPWVFAIMFWLTVIGGVIGGGRTGKSLYTFQNTVSSFMGSVYSGNEDGETGAMILGGLFGLIGGFLFAVWVFGVVATLLKMDENLQYLADKEKAKE